MSRARIVLVSFLLLTACGPVLAQFGGTRRGGADGGEGRARQRPGSELSGVTRLGTNDQIRMQLTNTRLALKLSPEQEAAWQAYESKVVSLLEDMTRGASAPESENALKQIDRKVDLARNRLAAMEDLSDAAKRLYAGLSVEQKATADQTIPGTVPALYVGLPASFGGGAGGRAR